MVGVSGLILPAVLGLLLGSTVRAGPWAGTSRGQDDPGASPWQGAPRGHYSLLGTCLCGFPSGKGAEEKQELEAEPALQARSERQLWEPHILLFPTELKMFGEEREKEAQNNT